MDLAILCRTARHLMATPTQSIKWIIKMALSKIGFVTRVFYFKFGLKSLLCLFIVFHCFPVSWFYREQPQPFEEFLSSKVVELQQYQAVLTLFI